MLVITSYCIVPFSSVPKTTGQPGGHNNPTVVWVGVGVNVFVGVGVCVDVGVCVGVTVGV